MRMPLEQNSTVDPKFYEFLNNELLPLTPLDSNKFWEDLSKLLDDLAPINRLLLATRDSLQNQLDEWHRANKENFDPQAYRGFLKKIGYLLEEGDDFSITTENVDDEIATLAGPQLVVPVKNARFALNAANARWGSLYDALYGSDVIPHVTGLKPSHKYNPARGNMVIAYARDFLDEIFPLVRGSHHDVKSYMVYYQHLLAIFPDGASCGLKNPEQYVAINGSKSEPESVVLCNNGLHVEICFDRQGSIGSKDLAGIEDIVVEGALTTIMDCEDSVAAVDCEDKIEVYRNWLGLMQGDLTSSFSKGGKTLRRHLNYDRVYTSKNGEPYTLPARSLLLVRNVGHLMESDLMQDSQGNFAPEGIMDAVVTALIGSLDLQKDSDHPFRNSRSGSIYIVKPKMHGPEEVAFSCQLFSRVEEMLGLAPNTLKMGIMDEERRTTVNLKECIRQAKDRVVFINTGFLDRTGDEIHTSMEAGAFLPKDQIKQQPWISAYEAWNVDVGIACGLPGKAQIGKGMWAMPDEMQKMMEAKVEHPRSGANTAWVPSPTAAVLHALHYHKVDVFAQQTVIKNRPRAKLDDILTIPLMSSNQLPSREEVQRELENNIQGILGYVVRWIELGIGCSKVPDINNIGLMEDRATLRISSQHIANWLYQGICDEQQVLETMEHMAKIVDEQNAGTDAYIPMTANLSESIAFNAAKALIFEGREQPNGYTEPLLHKYRMQAKYA